MRVGFIGTGSIGEPMARQLLSAGHELVVHDARPEATASLRELGAAWGADAREVAAACRVVLTSLPGPAEVEAVVTGADGLLTAAQPGDVHIDLSSNSVAMVRQLHREEAARGVLYIDCPVTGGVRRARRGALTLLASGERQAFERVEPLLQALGEHVFYVGEAGSGCLTKLINNAIVLCAGQLVQEGLVLGSKLGLEPERLYEMLKVGSAAPHIGLMPYMIGRRFADPTFTLALASKDVGLALEAARDAGVPMPVTAAAQQTYLAAMGRGLGEQSFLATQIPLEQGAGVEVPLVETDAGSQRL